MQKTLVLILLTIFFSKGVLAENNYFLMLKNNSGWIHTSQLRKNKSFILLENQILFSKPTKYSKPIAKISSGRLLLVKKCKLKWCRVKTENYTGWLEIKNVWGSIN